MKASELCQYLEWDSEFFGRRIARVAGDSLNALAAGKIFNWCEEHSIECLYFLADASDRASSVVAGDNCFRFVDARVTYERQVGDGEGLFEKASEIRLSGPEDVPALRALAARNHHDSRFYFDPGFPQPVCDALYATWIEKSCHGYADVVFVAEAGGRAAGYVTCHLRDDGERGEIGLIGVREEAQGKGLGRKLVNEALRWFALKGAHRVTVATQGRNLAAQRLYLKCGFRPASVQFWYHKWFSS